MFLVKNAFLFSCAFAGFSLAYPASGSTSSPWSDDGARGMPGPGRHGPGHIDPILKDHPYIPPHLIKGSSRSQCPLLNMFANHGFIPRDGRNIDAPTFTKSMIDALNYDPKLADAITTSMLALFPENPQAIDLERINNYTTGHDHDASFSRLDRIQWPELTPAGTPYGSLLPNKGLILEMSNDARPQGYPFLDTAAMARTRLRREAESIAAGSPPLSDALKLRAARETALALQFVGEGGDPQEIGGGEEVWDKRLTSTERMREWLLVERFPKGWKRTSHPVTDLWDITPIANRIVFWKTHGA